MLELKQAKLKDLLNKVDTKTTTLAIAEAITSIQPFLGNNMGD
jgi:hypothetical protein